MSLNLNEVILAGRITGDLALKSTPNGLPVLSFSIAVDHYSGKEEKKTFFFNCVAWRSTAEFISRFFSKGSPICVVGFLQSRSWDDPKGGGKRYATEVVIKEAKFVENKSSSQNGAIDSQQTAPQTSPAINPDPQDFTETTNTDEDYPF